MPEFFPELRPSYEISLSSAALNLIRNEMRAAPHGHEVGGWLLMDARRPYVVRSATGPGEDAVMQPEHLEINSDLDSIEEMSPGLTVAGCWHVHPTNDRLPSDTDRRAWMRGCQRNRAPWYSLILGPARNTWSRPEYTADITTGTNTTMFCERVAVREIF